MKLDRLITIITALAVATTFNLLSVAKPAAAIGVTGLTDNNTLINFDSNNPTATSSVPVTGLQSGSLIGIDYRPANNLLYGVTDTNSIYTINADTGAASFVSTLSTPFTGDVASGIDFNPVPDRLRLVGSNDQNFRINVDTGATTVDSPLTYAAGDVNAGVNPRITAEAYTNSFSGPPSPAGVTPPTRTTQLYGIDFGLDTLVVQNPPNAGTLNTIGSLGIDFDPTGGFDISSPASGVNTAFAATDSTLYTINLSTGAATSVGTIDGGNISLVGLAAEPVPEPSSVLGALAFGAIGAISLLKRKQKKNAQV